MNPSFWQLGLRQLWRDWRAGELRLLAVAVALAVAALTAVGFFADRLQAGLARDALALLGGDAVVVSDRETPPAFVQQARALGLEASTNVGFPTMGRAPDARGGAARLVALKAVQAGYPLRGQIRLADAPGGAVRAVRAQPEPGTVWVDAPLLAALELSVGDTLLLGDSALRIAAVIVQEPDRGGGFTSFAPRAMIHMDDLPATGLVQPASRITWRFAVAGAPGAVAAFSRWAKDQAQQPQVRGVRLESLESGRPEMRQTLDRAEKFLNLVALLAALLSAVAVALAARAYASAHLDDCAMLRVLGLGQRAIAGAYVTQFVLVGLAASLLGVLLGWGAHHVFVWLLGGLLDAALPAAGGWPVVFGLGMGLTLLLAFGLPPVLQLAQVPPLRVIRREVGNLKPASLLVLGLGVAGFAALLAASSDRTLGLIAVGGFALAVAVFAGLSWLAVKLLRPLVNGLSGGVGGTRGRAPRLPWLALATRQIAARPAYAVVQVSSLAVGLLALLLLVLLRTDLIQSWREASPPDAPNRMVINVMPEQGEEFVQQLRGAGVARFDWYPMIRGRLVAINGRAVTPESFSEARAQRMVDREFNLSHALDKPPHNEVVAGRWTPGEVDAISVEEGIAQTLGLKMGDVLSFDIAGQTHSARITSLRRVDWASMRANFFVMFPLARMDDVPLTHLAAFRAPDTPGFDNALVRAFPNITNVDLSATLAQVQSVLDKVIRAIEFLFGFTLAAGVIVLFAAVSATREERAREYAIMRAVGARGALLRQVQRAELLGVGLLAGLLAGAVAVGVGWALARYAFEFDWNAPPWVPLAGALAGALLALAAGWWGLREVLRRPVVQTLRRAAQ